MGMLGILPSEEGGTPATVDDALWLADACAYDHDAPVGVRPVFEGEWGQDQPVDPVGGALVTPVHDQGLTECPCQRCVRPVRAVREVRWTPRRPPSRLSP